MDQRLNRAPIELTNACHAITEFSQRGEWAIALACGDQGMDGSISEVSNGREAKENALPHWGEVDTGAVHIRGKHRNPHGIAVGDVALNLLRYAGIHGQQRRHVGHWVVSLEVGGLVGHGAIGRGMALVEAVLGKEHHLVKEFVGHLGVNAPLTRPLNKDAAMLLHLRDFLLTHGAPQQVGFAE